MSTCDKHKEIDIPLGYICPRCHMEVHAEVDKLKGIIRQASSYLAATHRDYVFPGDIDHLKKVLAR